MTHVLIYKQIVEAIFGSGTCSLDETSDATNNVIGALAAPNDYNAFRLNFLARLNRLKHAYAGQSGWKRLLDIVNEVGRKNTWDGAVAELAALDFFNSQRNFLFESPELDKSIDPARSLASRFGMSEANLDVYFPGFDVFTDVKVLKDNVSDILNGIYSKVWNTSRPLIHSQYPKDAGFDAIQKNHKAILRLMREATADGKQPPLIDCTSVVPNLTFRLEWSRGVLVTDSSYSPYRHAEEMHKLPFLHAKKFVTDRPFFLTFVMHPWFNGTVSEFRDSNKIFYRSLARRVFCQYQTDATKFSTWSSKFTGNETFHEVSRHLDAILFLEDRSIRGEQAADINVVGFYYENPNGHHPPSHGSMDMYLLELVHGDYDDFKHDNY